MSGSTTVIDNTSGGIIAPTAGGSTITATSLRGEVFTTSGASTWELSGIRLALAWTTPGTVSFTIGLYATSSSLPTGTALTSVSVSATVATAAAYFYFDETALGALANYSLSASTQYAVVLSSAESFRWAAITGAVVPTAYSGFTQDQFVGSLDGGSLWYAAGPKYAVQIDAQATCFLRGTLILTARGEVPVERLSAGDLVVAKFGGLRAVRWIGTQRFEGRLAGKGHQPIRFARGSLGGGMPSCDLWVSPGHAVLVGEVLAHAGALVNGGTITQEKVRGTIEYFHLDLGPHDCVLANGAWAESYFEDRNRDSFHNAAEFHALHPGHVAERQANCLPIVTAAHPGIAALRRGWRRWCAGWRHEPVAARKTKTHIGPHRPTRHGSMKIKSGMMARSYKIGGIIMKIDICLI